MLVYLDSNVVMYVVEQPPQWGPRATARIGVLLAGGHRLAVSDITRLECRVGPLATGNLGLLALFDSFFTSGTVQVFPVATVTCDRATLIRARHRYRLGDALNLAAAVEGGCAVFLTNDIRLSAFPDLTVELLP